MFFKKSTNKNKNIDFIKIAALLIHAAKIDEEFTIEEEEIIKKTIIILGANSENLDDIIKKAKETEENAYQILEFTREVKIMNIENKIIIVETLWRIILSDGKSDIYENNLMRRLAGLLYLDDKIVGETKVKLLNNKK